jgi:cellulose synthase/poly-beta-1,6-N-acetylglucosamine synthase-like glycosyltransferase
MTSMSSRRNTALAVALGAATLRQALVLNSILRSHRFLRSSACGATSTTQSKDSEPRILILLPVLRETALLSESVQHFTDLARGHNAAVVVVTTERERAERSPRGETVDTITLAAQLAADGKCLHLHYPDPRGVKADQLNFAVRALTEQAGDIDPDRTWILCYDADSRPPLDTLDRFLETLAAHPETDVLHQSSRFEVRDRTPGPLQRAVADAGALRANRFVLAYELPRLLNRSGAVGAVKRRLSSYVYSHVTGHGLLVRLSLLRDIPFPDGSPLEDMHYSFILNSRNAVMRPVPSLDVADVPASLSVQVDQAARWFYGPGRFRRYRRDPSTSPGLRAWILSASAAGICGEWLSCAVVPVSIVLALWKGSPAVRTTAGTFVSTYATQLIVTDVVMSPALSPGARILRLFAYPSACTLFGVGGVIGAARLATGDSGTGKTERSTP